MNRKEALDIAVNLKNECEKHLSCSECPVYVKEINDCLLGDGGVDLERIEYFGGFRKPDNVNHPSHYTQGRIECIEALEAATVNLKGIEAVCTANAIKYLWRWKEKNGKEDLKKAIWYIDKLIGDIGADECDLSLIHI